MPTDARYPIAHAWELCPAKGVYLGTSHLEGLSTDPPNTYCLKCGGTGHTTPLFHDLSRECKIPPGHPSEPDYCRSKYPEPFILTHFNSMGDEMSREELTASTLTGKAFTEWQQGCIGGCHGTGRVMLELGGLFEWALHQWFVSQRMAIISPGPSHNEWAIYYAEGACRTGDTFLDVAAKALTVKGYTLGEI